MIVLGITTYIKNPAACVLKDGKLVALAEEERFLRVKNPENTFPFFSIKYCLSEAKITLSDVDKIAIGWDFSKYRTKMPLFFLKNFFKYFNYSKDKGSFAKVLDELLTNQPRYVRKRLAWDFSRLTRGKLPEIEFIPHHLAHAATAFYTSGFDESPILVIDGSGEERVTSFFSGKGRKIEEKGHIDMPNSLGWYYAALSAFLGFTPYREDGFLMGLAPYGTRNKHTFKKFEKIIKIKEKSYKANPLYTLLGTHSVNEHFSDELIDLLGKPRQKKEKITKRHKDFAFATQYFLEEAVISLVRKATEGGEKRRICLAGGVALNCKMNGRILESGLVDEIFVQPISNDAGSSLGAAMVVSEKEGDDPRFKMDNVYLGPKFGKGEIKRLLDNSGLEYEKPKSIEKRAAKAISEGKIVGWFQGRMEAGPRALGNRSILADPSKKGMQDAVNNKVKFRDPWRPFCPSIVEEAADKYLEGLTNSKKESRFMIVTYQIKRDKKEKLSQTVHTDLSTRPQLVKKSVNPRYYRLIKEFEKITKIPAVLNTSFNVKGEPIVCTPDEALRCFVSTGMDALAVGDYWIEK